MSDSLCPTALHHFSHVIASVLKKSCVLQPPRVVNAQFGCNFLVILNHTPRERLLCHVRKGSHVQRNCRRQLCIPGTLSNHVDVIGNVVNLYEPLYHSSVWRKTDVLTATQQQMWEQMHTQDEGRQIVRQPNPKQK